MHDLPPEILLVTGVGGELNIRESHFEVFRPMSASPTARVDIAGPSGSLSLPVILSPDRNKETYGRWLLRQLGLNAFEVPSAPTRPESDKTLVSINDYLSYCDLPKEEIRSEIFGHRNPYKNIKRKYVFQILYGQFSARTAELLEELRRVRRELEALELDEASLRRTLEGTVWGNRAALSRELHEKQVELDTIERKAKGTASNAVTEPATQSLRQSIVRLDVQVTEIKRGLEQEVEGIQQLSRLKSQLELQHARLTRAVVANEVLGGLEFVVCPRCGSPVDQERGNQICCYLCLQNPPQQRFNQDIVGEQTRVVAQIGETEELIASRAHRQQAQIEELGRLSSMRQKISEDLDFATQTYVSDRIEAIQSEASKRAELKAEIGKLTEYLSLFDRRASTGSSVEVLRRREDELEANLEQEAVRRADYEARIQQLERELTQILARFEMPRFLREGLEARIDRETLLPVVNGRSFDSLLSEGLSVEVNIAHALAHQLMSLRHGIPLPNILLIDGISGAFGAKGLDPQRISAIYRCLIEFASEFHNDLQIIVVDNRIASVVTDEYVVLELNERDRLIPTKEVERLRASTEHSKPISEDNI